MYANAKLVERFKRPLASSNCIAMRSKRILKELSASYNDETKPEEKAKYEDLKSDIAKLNGEVTERER